VGGVGEAGLLFSAGAGGKGLVVGRTFGDMLDLDCFVGLRCASLRVGEYTQVDKGMKSHKSTEFQLNQQSLSDHAIWGNLARLIDNRLLPHNLYPLHGYLPLIRLSC
jgi:hypothetical protein